MSRDRRNIFVKGLGNLYVREVDPVSGSQFVDVGYVKETDVKDIYDMERVPNDQGLTIDYLEKGQSFEIATQLLQTAKEQVDFLTGVAGRIHSARYFGQANPIVFQYYLIEQCRLSPSITLGYKVGLRTLPVVIVGLAQLEFTYQIPVYYLFEAQGVMHVRHAVYFADPSMNLNGETDRLLDISGFARHGTFNSDYATIWQTAAQPYFLRFDGVNDQLNLGDVMDSDDTFDFALECWARVQGADASLQEVMAKKTAVGTSAGFGIYRNAANQVQLSVGDGTTAVNVVSAATLLQNVWKHIFVAVDINGNAQVYVNGVASGAAVSVAALGSMANALNFYLGRDNTNFGQVDISDVRVHNFGADYIGAATSTPMATIAADHYTAQRVKHGV